MTGRGIAHLQAYMCVCLHSLCGLMGNALHLLETVRCPQGAVHQGRVGKTQCRVAAVFISLRVRHLVCL